MSNQRFLSVFDVLGPVMVGPSSSHTAGALRLGKMGRALLGATPNNALIELHGSFAETGRGHGTDKAIIAGLLGMEPDNEDIKHSFDLATDSGMQFTFQVADLGDDCHPNSLRMSLSAGSEKIQMQGASIGGGQIEVTRLDNYPISLSGEFDTLLVVAGDQPGTVNAITGWLLSQNINVAYLSVSREGRGGDAIMVIETDDPVPDSIVAGIRNFEWVYWARRIPKLSN